MTWVESETLSLSILIAAVIAIFKNRRTDNKYFPFFILVWIASANEIASGFLMYFRHLTNINNNIYVLCEALLILWFFKGLKTVFRSQRFFGLLVAVTIVFWVVENLVFRTINNDISFYFRVYYSFVTVLCSITTVNYLIVREGKSLSKSPVFLICLGFIIYFTYKILVEAFELYGLNYSVSFEVNVYTIMIYLNLLVNLLYALAVLWMPPKRKYILLS